MVNVEDFLKTVRIPLDEKWGYILGTRGELWTKAKQDKVEKAYHDGDTTKELAAKYGAKWIGRKVTDCSGLIKWALIQNGSDCAHGSNTIWKKYLSDKGEVGKGDLILPGYLVFKCRNKTDYYHVGVYIGAGLVIEARGTYYGVKTSKLNTWTHYGKLKVIDYGNKASALDKFISVHKEEFKLGKYEVTAESGKTVRMRKGDSTHANVLVDVPVGATVEVVEDAKNGFAKVHYIVEGYMMKDFLKKE